MTVAGSGAAGVSVAGNAGTSGSSQSIANGQGSSLSSTQAVAGAQPTGAYAPAGTQGYTAQPTAASTLTPSQQIYNQVLHSALWNCTKASGGIALWPHRADRVGLEALMSLSLSCHQPVLEHDKCFSMMSFSARC